MRIVSLLPAATDIVCTLGLRDSLVGRTHECDWPPGALGDVPVVTTSSLDSAALSSREISLAVRDSAGAHSGSSLFGLDTDLLADLAPDLLLTQELCEVCAVSYAAVSDAARVLDTGPRVVSLEPTTLAGVLDCLRTVGTLTGTANVAEREIDALQGRLARLSAQTDGLPPVRTVVLEWLDPVWPAGHWVPEQVGYAGGVDLLGEAGTHTSPVEWSAVVAARPDALLLAPCGLAIERTCRELDTLTALPGWADLPAVAAGRVWALDGPGLYNRPGPRVVRGAEVLAGVLHGLDVGLRSDEAVQLLP